MSLISLCTICRMHGFRTELVSTNAKFKDTTVELSSTLLKAAGLLTTACAELYTLIADVNYNQNAVFTTISVHIYQLHLKEALQA